MRIYLAGGLKPDSKIIAQLKSQVKPSCHIETDLESNNNHNPEELTAYDFHLYIISPGMKGISPVVQLVDDSNKKPGKTIYCFIDKDNGDEFSTHQLKSLKAIAQMVKRNGGTWIESLEGVIKFINSRS